MEFGDVDVGVVQGTVAAVDEQLAQRRHARRVGVLGASKQRGDFGQVGARSDDSVVRPGVATTRERVLTLGLFCGPP